MMVVEGFGRGRARLDLVRSLGRRRRRGGARLYIPDGSLARGEEGIWKGCLVLGCNHLGKRFSMRSIFSA